MKRYLVLFFGLFVAVFAFGWWWTSPPYDPPYQGHPLSWWLREAQSSSKASNHDVAEAVKQNGATALRWLTWAAEHGHRPDPAPAPEAMWKSILRTLYLLPPVRSAAGSYDERAAAVEAVGRLYPSSQPAIPALSRLLEDPDEELATSAAESLREMQPQGWPALLKASSHPSAQVRRLAVRALVLTGYVGHPPSSEADIAAIVGALVKAFSDSDASVRSEAVTSFGNWRGQGARNPLFKESLPRVVALLSDPDPLVRQQAGWAISTFGSEASAAVPKLIIALDDADPRVRARMACALSGVDLGEQQSKARLWKMTEDRDLACRIAAAAALGRFGEKAAVVITELIGLLQSSDATMRATAMNGLTDIGAPASEAMPAILESLKLPIEPTALPWQIVANFDRFDRAAAILSLVEAMSHPRADVRGAAAEFFCQGKGGTDRAEVRQALQDATRDTDEQVRRSATRALERMMNYK